MRILTWLKRFFCFSNDITFVRDIFEYPYEYTSGTAVFRCNKCGAEFEATREFTETYFKKHGLK